MREQDFNPGRGRTGLNLYASNKSRTRRAVGLAHLTKLHRGARIIDSRPTSRPSSDDTFCVNIDRCGGRRADIGVLISLAFIPSLRRPFTTNTTAPRRQDFNDATILIAPLGLHHTMTII